MTEGKARELKVEAVVDVPDLRRASEPAAAIGTPPGDSNFEKQTVKIKNRFVRLKKSLRKRSVSIL